MLLTENIFGAFFLLTATTVGADGASKVPSFSGVWGLFGTSKLLLLLFSRGDEGYEEGMVVLFVPASVEEGDGGDSGVGFSKSGKLYFEAVDLTRVVLPNCCWFLISCLAAATSLGCVILYSIPRYACCAAVLNPGRKGILPTLGTQNPLWSQEGRQPPPQEGPR